MTFQTLLKEDITLKVATLCLAATLTACGGGGSATTSEDCTIGLYGDSVSNGYLAPGKRMSPTPAEYLSALTGRSVVDYSYNGASVLDFKPNNESIMILRYGVADALLGTSLQEYRTAYSKPTNAIIVAPTQTIDGRELAYIYRDDIPYRLKPATLDGYHPTEEYSRAVTEKIAEHINKLCK